MISLLNIILEVFPQKKEWNYYMDIRNDYEISFFLSCIIACLENLQILVKEK